MPQRCMNCIVAGALLLWSLPAVAFEATGQLGSRATVSGISADSTLSTRDTPAQALLLDANVQGKARLLDERLTLSTDVSGFVPLQRDYFDASDGELQPVADHDVATVRPFVVLSEAYVELQLMEHLRATLGKQRTVFGPGFMISATDTINPLRDPTDPSSQRTGVWLAKLEAPLEHVTFTGMLVATTLEETAGLPSQLGLWSQARQNDPGDATVDDDLHYVALARVYTLLLDTDVNAWASVAHNNGDTREWHPTFAMTLSRNIFTIHEVHAEVLLEQGSTRRQFNTACDETSTALIACARQGVGIVETPLIESRRLLPKIVVGWRPMLNDGSMFSVEYFYQADGLIPDEMRRYKKTLGAIGEMQRNGLSASPAGLGSGNTTGGTPVRFAFTPQRRHYVLLNAQKPQLFDDWTVGASAIIAAEDLSSLLSANVLYAFAENATVGASVFMPTPSLLSDGLGEFDGAPFWGRCMLEARLYF